VMYALSFIIGYYPICYLAQKRGAPLDRDGVADLVFYLVAGVLFGGRLGYVLVYNLPYYMHHPAEIVAVWDGGMSFHGGLIGVIVAALLFSRKTGIGFLSLADFMVPVVPLGLFGANPSTTARGTSSLLRTANGNARGGTVIAV
jgi:phosphatidylglycerol---prolipoprotein diacylglyceryl transferase